MDAESPYGSFDRETNTLTLRGEWDFAWKETLRTLADQLHANSEATIDLVGASFIDSSVINEIARTYNRLGKEGPRLRLLVGDDRVARLLHVTGIDRIVNVERKTR